MTPRQKAISDWLFVTKATLLSLSYFLAYLENWEKIPLLRTPDEGFLKMVESLDECGLADWLSQADADLSDLRREVTR